MVRRGKHPDFVDAVADAALNDNQAPETLPGMLQVYTWVVDDSPAVLALFEEASMTSSMFDAMNSVFLRKMNRLSDAIWSMMEKVRTSFATDDCWRVSSAEVGGVHRTTRLMMNYIMLLSHPITTRARLKSSSRIRSLAWRISWRRHQILSRTLDCATYS